MNLFTSKTKITVASLCVVGLVGIMGCTFGQAESAEAEAMTGEEVTIVEVQKVWGPNYDNAETFININSPTSMNQAIALQWGPNYDGADISLGISSLAQTNQAIAQQWGPNYDNADTSTGISSPALLNQAIAQQWGPNYDNADTLVGISSPGPVADGPTLTSLVTSQTMK